VLAIIFVLFIFCTSRATLIPLYFTLDRRSTLCRFFYFFFVFFVFFFYFFFVFLCFLD
jgi:hypothetical protein